MNFEFFESITNEQAKELLQEFLACGKKHTPSLIQTLSEDGLKADFSLDSVGPILTWGAAQVQFTTRPMGSEIPVHIRDVHGGVYRDFTEKSRGVVMACAYYLGESFVRCGSQLTWGLGSEEYIEARMPVVKGFLYGLELAPLMIVGNVFRRLSEGRDRRDPQLMVDHWREDIPPVAVST